MKNLIITTIILVVAVCSFFAVKKSSAPKNSPERVVAADEQRDPTSAREEKKTAELQTRLRETQKKAIATVEENEALKQRLAKTETAARDPKSAAIFRDPQMKETLKAEAKHGIEKNVNELFKAGLAKQLHLNGDQAWTLKDLLTQKQMVFWDKVMLPMAAGELDQANMAEAGRATKQAFDESTAKIRALLGDGNFSAYEQFEKAQADRESLKRLSPKFAEAGQALSAEQQSQLLAAMNEERSNFKFQFDIGDPAHWNYENLYDNFTEDKINGYCKDMEQLNGRISQRVQAVLTPEQVSLLKTCLAQQLLQAKMTARMTTAMFGKKQ